MFVGYGPDEDAESVDRPALLADNFSKITWVNLDFVGEVLFADELIDDYFVLVVHELLDDVKKSVFKHCSP